MHEGSCLCGDVRYRIDGELSEFGHCHCGSCRKASGSAFASNAGVDRDRIAITDRHGRIVEYASSPGKIRAFCSRCGSPLYAYLEATPGVLRIRLGSLDTPLEDVAKAHTFVSEKAPWYRITDDLPQFDGWAPRAVLTQKGSRQP